MNDFVQYNVMPHQTLRNILHQRRKKTPNMYMCMCRTAATNILIKFKMAAVG